MLELLRRKMHETEIGPGQKVREKEGVGDDTRSSVSYLTGGTTTKGLDIHVRKVGDEFSFRHNARHWRCWQIASAHAQREVETLEPERTARS